MQKARSRCRRSFAKPRAGAAARSCRPARHRGLRAVARSRRVHGASLATGSRSLRPLQRPPSRPPARAGQRDRCRVGHLHGRDGVVALRRGARRGTRPAALRGVAVASGRPRGAGRGARGPVVGAIGRSEWRSASDCAGGGLCAKASRRSTGSTVEIIGPSIPRPPATRKRSSLSPRCVRADHRPYQGLRVPPRGAGRRSPPWTQRDFNPPAESQMRSSRNRRHFMRVTDLERLDFQGFLHDSAVLRVPENRGVPGSSPGLAMFGVGIRSVAGFSGCRCHAFEGSDTSPGNRGVVRPSREPEKSPQISVFGIEAEVERDALARRFFDLVS
jgi:hypothetical protein